MMIKLVKYVIASRGEPQSPFGWFLYVGLQFGGCTISDSNTSFHPADVISLQTNGLLHEHNMYMCCKLKVSLYSQHKGTITPPLTP